MVSNRLGLAVIGLASVVAAGVGGFVAMRQTDQPAIAASASGPGLHCARSRSRDRGPCR